MKLENHKKKTYEYDEFYYCVNDSGDDYIHIRREVDIPKSWEYIDFIGDYQEWITYPEHEQLEKLYQEWKLNS